MSHIDDFDLKMLTLLQGNGRLSNHELSEQVGLSASQCSRRRIALEQAGLILGYHARLSPQAMNTEVVAMVEVSLVNHHPDTCAAFETFARHDNAVVDVYKTTGEADYSLKVAVAGLAQLNTLMGRMTASATIGHLKTAIVLERLKEAGLPANDQAMPPSEALPR